MYSDLWVLVERRDRSIRERDIVVIHDDNDFLPHALRGAGLGTAHSLLCSVHQKDNWAKAHPNLVGIFPELARCPRSQLEEFLKENEITVPVREAAAYLRERFIALVSSSNIRPKTGRNERLTTERQPNLGSESNNRTEGHQGRMKGAFGTQIPLGDFPDAFREHCMRDDRTLEGNKLAKNQVTIDSIYSSRGWFFVQFCQRGIMHSLTIPSKIVTPWETCTTTYRCMRARLRTRSFSIQCNRQGVCKDATSVILTRSAGPRHDIRTCTRLLCRS